jgi:thymidylate kinase
MANGHDLRKNAREILERLENQGFKRPIFVEFSGTPKSGKSTCIDIVSHFFRRLKYRVLAPTEGASKRTPYYLKNDLAAFNTWSACYALTHVLEAIHHSDRYHLAVLDRGLFDALVWFELLATNGTISRHECDRIHKFLLVEKWSSAIDIVFLFKTDPGTSLKRENLDKLVSDPGVAMNDKFLISLNKAYERAQKKYANHFSNFHLIDTSETAHSTPRSTAEEVVGRILKLFPTRKSRAST